MFLVVPLGENWRKSGEGEGGFNWKIGDGYECCKMGVMIWREDEFTLCIQQFKAVKKVAFLDDSYTPKIKFGWSSGLSANFLSFQRPAVSEFDALRQNGVLMLRHSGQ